MIVAFTTSTGVKIDGNFRTAQEFSVWDIGPKRVRYVTTISFADDANNADGGITNRANSLKGCALICAPQISGPATAKLAARNIHTLKVRENTLVWDVIDRLQTVLRRTNPPPWMHKAQLGSAGSVNIHVRPR